MQTVHVSPKHRMVGVPAGPEIKNLFPAAKELDFGGKPLMLVPHAPVETFMLRRMGYDVPAPILTSYDWTGGSPFDVQRQTCAMMTMEPRAYVLNGMGTGKTKAALWAFDYLKGNGLAKRMLVVGPLSTLNFVWRKEAFETLPTRRVVVLHGDKKRRLERLKDPEAEILVVNHDGVKVIAEELLRMIEAGEIDVICIDELAAFRSGKADRTKIMRKLAAKAKWVWGMTGSPMPNEVTDVWAQATIVNPTTVPKSFNRFRDDLMQKITQFKYVAKDDAVERAYAALQPAVRFNLDDVMELPEAIGLDPPRLVEVDMGKEQARIYKELSKACYAAVQSHEITAANAGAVMQKLLQVSCGWVYTADGRTVSLDNNTRIQALLDAIESTDRKVLVFAPFKHALAGIDLAMTTEGIDHAIMSGDTPASARSEMFNLFQNTQKYKVLAAHPQCLAHGVTLTSADTVIWFGPTLSLEIYDQANHRIRRVGQKHKQLYLHFASTPVEKKAYAMLHGKQKVQQRLLELFEDHTESNPQR